MHPSSLPWTEVDPRRTGFDEAAARSVARQAAVGRERDQVQAALDAAFVARFGPWAHGWLWGRGEAELDGGPVAGWCCPQHCVLRRGEQDLGPTAERAAAALIDWRRHLERLAALYGSLPPEGGLEDAALELVAFSVEATGADSGWYSHALTVLDWYLQHWGARPDRARRAARRAVDGRFESWIGPPDEAMLEVAADFDRLARQALR